MKWKMEVISMIDEMNVNHKLTGIFIIYSSSNLINADVIRLMNSRSPNL